jgi:CBS domain containing-hemolysin-like protein
VQAQIDLESVNQILDLNLPLTDEYTLGGFLLHQFQKLPVQGETLSYNNLELTVVSASGPRLHQIRIHRVELTATSSNIDNPNLDQSVGNIDENSSNDRPLKY